MRYCESESRVWEGVGRGARAGEVISGRLVGKGENSTRSSGSMGSPEICEFGFKGSMNVERAIRKMLALIR